MTIGYVVAIIVYYYTAAIEVCRYHKSMLLPSMYIATIGVYYCSRSILLL